MWRKCDLHRHTVPDSDADASLDPQEFLSGCVAEGLNVVAVTDHDRVDNVDAVSEKAVDYGIVVVPGIEISTDRGHVLALAPGADGRAILDELRIRLAIQPGKTIDFYSLINCLAKPRVNGGDFFRNHVILIGAHVERSGSVLGPKQPASLDEQIEAAQKLQALEVVAPEILTEWSNGVKQTESKMALLRGSDAHPEREPESRFTWIYLPEVTPQSLRHALATPEASISLGAVPPDEPEFWVKSLSFEGGPYDGRKIGFSPRANALIGPPSSGKSLVVDAISFAYGLPCSLDDVRASIDARLAKCLPEGATVVLEVMGPQGVEEVRRVMGGTTIQETEAKPIVFSQTELARRAMESVPAVELLDIHCPEGEIHRAEIERASEAARSALAQIFELATQSGALRLVVENEQEGLEATRAKYFDLVGDEETAKSLGDLARLDGWHQRANESLLAWRAALTVPPGPQLPPVPTLETDRDVAEFVPSEATEEALSEYQNEVVAAADGLVDSVRSEFAKGSQNVEGLRKSVEERLGEGHDAIREVADEAQVYRERLAELESQASDLADLDKKIGDQLREVDHIIDRASRAWTDLRRVRGLACTAVNASMPSFIVRLNHDSLTAEMDDLLGDLRVGTHLYEASVHAARKVLDRKDFVRAAVEQKQFPASGHHDEDATDPLTAARKIAGEAAKREKYDEIARLAVLWPADGIKILQRQTGTDPVPFDNLTEGLKALAIKEISFAASQLPAVTDQPEDAVPTTAVFEKLVPTVREQRRSRQFIIASHDANVVVSGDMDRVIVLPPHPSEPPIAGTLFDAPIRESAIALLEGGDRAFQLRQRRYGDYD